MKRMRNFLMVLATVFTALLSAQVTTSSLSGRITDGKEGLTGAIIKAIHEPTGTVYVSASQKNGNYHLQNLRVGGPYVVTVTFTGYEKQTFSGIELNLGSDVALDVTLSQSSTVLKEVSVVGERNSVINSSRTGSQEFISREKMDRLPTINRSLSDFTKLTPMSSNGNYGGVSYRYNNVTVDGASFNNSFGLSSALGASGTEPISLESLDQIQVMLAPFDVRNGAFTGAGINSVTKSGSNDFKASVYTYVKSPNLDGVKQGDVTVDRPKYDSNQFGLSLSGPIIKDKLFYFVNYERDRKSTPIDWQPSAAPLTPSGGGVSAADKQTLQGLSDFLGTQFGYTPGSYTVSSIPTQADRLTARIDWNVSSNSVLSLKYYYLKSFATYAPSSSGAYVGGRNASQFSIPFSSAYYRGNNNFNIFMADLVTNFNPNLSNTLKVGYSALRDFRDMDGGFFPQVDILNGTGSVAGANQVKGTAVLTTFGTEANSYNNKLNSDIYQIQDNLSYTLDNHQIIIGTQSDYRKFKNGFAQNYPGSWVYNTVADFQTDVTAYKAYLANPTGTYKSTALQYKEKYSMFDYFPYANVDVLTLGFYLQDKWRVTPNLNLTYGLRLDVPIFTNSLAENSVIAGETFQGGVKVDVSKYPSANILLSPRAGFNWDVLGNNTLQLRGGSGMFSGTPPYVWLSNQSGNNGLLFGDISFATGGMPYGFTGVIDGNKPSTPAATKTGIAITDSGFKYPQLWKNDFAIDYKFLGGWIATAEVLYGKDINSIYHTNIALPDPSGTLASTLGNPITGSAQAFDNRTFFTTTSISTKVTDAILMKNTNKGYSLYTTLQLQRDFTKGEMKGLSVNASYTFGESKGVSDGSSSVASSAWKYRPAVDPNAEELGYSAGSFPHRFLLSASYRKEYARNFASSFGIVFQSYSPFRYSYTYNGDINGDGQTANDLIFIPVNQSQINLVKDGATDTRTVSDIWNQLDAFISQDQYLSKHRGEYSERNGGVAPFVNKIDLNFSQDFMIPLSNGKKNILRFSFDIANFGNLLNKDWGVEKTTMLGSASSPQYQFLKVVTKPTTSNNFTPGLTFPLVSSAPLSSTFQDYINSSSRYSIQIGVKYIFN